MKDSSQELRFKNEIFLCSPPSPESMTSQLPAVFYPQRTRLEVCLYSFGVGPSDQRSASTCLGFAFQEFR